MAATMMTPTPSGTLRERLVSRTEMTPVDLLAQAAYMYPEKGALVHSGRDAASV
jgi:hypothetical protein